MTIGVGQVGGQQGDQDGDDAQSRAARVSSPSFGLR